MLPGEQPQAYWSVATLTVNEISKWAEWSTPSSFLQNHQFTSPGYEVGWDGRLANTISVVNVLLGAHER